MRPLTITLPTEALAKIHDGTKRIISHKRNPRLDRYFSAKSPATAKINGEIFKISRIEETASDWIIHV